MTQAQTKSMLFRVLKVCGVLLLYSLVTFLLMVFGGFGMDQKLAWFLMHVWLQPGMCLVYLFGQAADSWVVPVNLLLVAVVADARFRDGSAERPGPAG